MSQYYRIEIDQPTTSTKAGKNWVWAPDSGIVESADIELHKDGKRLSTLTLTIWDHKEGRQWWPIANALPDPAFADVPLRCYLSKPGESGSASKLVFDGKVTSLQPSWPGPSNVTIVASDRSIDMRIKASYKTIKNKTSVQLAQQIASDYGFTVDTSELVGIVLAQRVIDMGTAALGVGPFSDWNHIKRALAVDGLELYMKGKTVHVRQSAQTVYPTTFRPDDGHVIEFRPTINHIRGPGQGGQSKNPLPGGNKGTLLSEQGSKAQEASAEKADATTHRNVPQGPSATHTGAHTESTGDNTNPSVQRRKRKDEAQLLVRALPDIGLQHVINLSGWGAKFDGQWHLATVRHFITGTGPAQTSLSLTSQPSTAGAKSGGVILPGGTRG